MGWPYIFYLEREMGRRKRAKPTDDVVKILSSNTLKDSASILKLSKTCVRAICLDNDIEFLRVSTISRGDWGSRKRTIAEDWDEGETTIMSLSKKTGLGRSVCCRNLGLPPLPLAMCYLKRDAVERIVRETPDGMSLDEYLSFVIAEVYEQ